MIVPNTSPDSSNQDDVHGAWVGLQPSSANAVLQNVVLDEDGPPGQWEVRPEYCCADEELASPQRGKLSSALPRFWRIGVSVLMRRGSSLSRRYS
jgi:hypothetical protein